MALMGDSSDGRKGSRDGERPAALAAGPAGGIRRSSGSPRSGATRWARVRGSGQQNWQILQNFANF